MIEVAFRLVFTGVTWLIFGTIVSAIWFDSDVKKMPNWWKVFFGLPLMLIGLATFVTVILAIWIS